MTLSTPGTGPSTFALRGRLVTPEGVIEDGAVVVDGEWLAWVGPRADAEDAGYGDVVAAAEEPAEGTTILPGLVDIHNHGGGGASFPDATTPEEAMVAVLEHRRHGTTTMLASLVTADRETLVARSRMLGELAEAGEIAGLHLEGPFLSEARRGAQNPAYMVPGDAALVREVAEASGGHLRTMTVAPEEPGVAGPDGAAAALVEVGAIPSVGHTDASEETTASLIAEVSSALAERAATGGVARRMTATHLFNGMRPLHHREPGPVAACLAAAARGEIVVELVADGTHLADGTTRSVFDLLGARRIALVTDAMAAAGMADGQYVLGPVEVTVADGVARLTDGGSIAGGTFHLLDVVRATVDAGVDVAAAVRAASLTPAEVLGTDEVGALRAGRRADVLVTDAALTLRRVVRGGVEVDTAAP